MQLTVKFKTNIKLFIKYIINIVFLNVITDLHITENNIFINQYFVLFLSKISHTMTCFDYNNKIFSPLNTNSHAGGYESDPSTPMVYSCSTQYRIHTHGVFRGLQVSISYSHHTWVHSQDTIKLFVLLGCAHIGPRSGHGVQRHTGTYILKS